MIFVFRTVLTVVDEREEYPPRPLSAFGATMEDNDGKHFWLKCMFKNPTFCLVCGKIVSVLGIVVNYYLYFYSFYFKLKFSTILIQIFYYKTR